MAVESEQLTIPTKNALFPLLEQFNYEQVVYRYDKATSLKAIIVVHSTTLGPSLGGLRMWNYVSEQEALTDALRLSRGMTLKAAISELKLGGGKAVIIGDSNTLKTGALLRRFGQFVNEVGDGRYITSSDVGMGEDDMQQIRSVTKHVTGLPESMGGAGSPAPATAYGTFLGIKAATKEKYGTDSLEGKHVAVQGVGNVGMHLVKHLIEDGARVSITDIAEEKIAETARKFDVNIITEDEIYDLDMDIYAPCALGASLNDHTIPRLKCSIIAGSANNQLADENRHGNMLMDKDILYAPDFLVNAGGLINVYYEYLGDYNREKTYLHIDRIYQNCLNVFDIAKHQQITPHMAATRIAKERLSSTPKN